MHYIDIKVICKSSLKLFIFQINYFELSIHQRILKTFSTLVIIITNVLEHQISMRMISEESRDTEVMMLKI